MSASDAVPPPIVECCPKPLRPQALRLLFWHRTPHDRELAAEALEREFAAGRLDFEALFLAVRAGRPVGAGLARRDAGRAVVVWRPGLLEAEPSSTAVALITACVQHAARHGATFAQALAEPDDETEHAWWRAAGFRWATELLYLLCPRNQFSAAAPPGSPRLAAFRPEDRDRMRGIIEGTYAGTQDCPLLNDLRRTDDVLASYEEVGERNSQRWFFLQADARDVGCLLLADHPRDEQLELVYFGLLPEVRGRGWGRVAVSHALDQARRLGRERLVLAVDAANEPALAVYETLGFWQWARKAIFLRPMGEGNS